ncbi:acetamidase/formamidase family protein [Nostoc sp. FACHB-87]|uniref:acetamidase/formamidase family protein n=1 Tax=Nostocales TaxID=1161 RepID=UPI0016865F37|nr:MULTISPECIES: acetamidase/formamidase family protein [Nostocales]MBD2300398.1 acetamidase/formamidase family protein [Nostoc sp. FACHB-190]MBD2457840.1 acetamidase/formamidase family protein [Nostoc sp. FACHB-87]MBD2479066.1 acetamidase/formamidase family protein [Anabaena sp. FACHB-83]MBD2487918.1 acetamidase/formamidase family protein [Aulosira sp. FACHB-615]
MTHHILKATTETVHLGGFSHLLKPALIINSGDTVDVETFTGYYIYDKAPPEFLTPEFVDICQNLPDERKIAGGPHLLTGPIYVRDAEPGDVLEVRLEAIAPSLPVGFNAIRTGWGALAQQFTQPALRFIPLDLANNIAEFPANSGIKIPLTPFFGILGVATPQSDRSSIPPGHYGGNIDNRELQVGSRVFLPIYVPGALFSIGDGHSAQGDGEVNVTAIETSMNGRISLTLRKDLSLTTPIAETPTDIITMGFAETLDAALEQALKNMIAFLQGFANLSAEEAYVLCSLAVNFRITQVVNSPQKGVHGMLPKSIFSPKMSL